MPCVPRTPVAEENGRAVFRLEALASENGISQPRAHDARDDVWATLGLARALRAAQPKLFAYYLGLRDKQRARSLLPKPLRAFAFMCRAALIWLVGASP